EVWIVILLSLKGVCPHQATNSSWHKAVHCSAANARRAYRSSQFGDTAAAHKMPRIYSVKLWHGRHSAYFTRLGTSRMKAAPRGRIIRVGNVASDLGPPRAARGIRNGRDQCTGVGMTRRAEYLLPRAGLYNA